MGAPSIAIPGARRVASSGTMVSNVLGHPALLREQGKAPGVGHGGFWQVREDAHPAQSLAALSSGVSMSSFRFHTVRKRIFPPEKT